MVLSGERLDLGAQIGIDPRRVSPAWRRARTREENSWPMGKPQKRILPIAPGWPTAKVGRRVAASEPSRQESSGEKLRELLQQLSHAPGGLTRVELGHDLDGSLESSSGVPGAGSGSIRPASRLSVFGFSTLGPDERKLRGGRERAAPAARPAAAF